MRPSPESPRGSAPSRAAPLALLALLVLASAGVALVATAQPPDGPPVWNQTLDQPTSSAILGTLPDGEAKRRLVLDCTGCHQLNLRTAYPTGTARTADDWEATVTRMLRYGSARGGFPVIHDGREARATAAWLATHLPATPPQAVRDADAPWRALVAPRDGWTLTEYPLTPVAPPWELPHDVAVDAAGRVVITGMLTHRMYVLDPRTGTLDTVAVPVPRANPRAVEVDAAGRWWVALGAPQRVAVRDPAKGAGADAWRTFATGMYPHSVALGADGTGWFNGHFTRRPELIGRVTLDGAGRVDSVAVAPHPTLADVPGGPIPYEIRVAPDGVVWTSELSGNRLVAHDPRTRRTWAVPMPEPHSGPRRFDVDAQGVLWIPAYAANALVRYDPQSERFTRVPLPIPDAVPYVARVDRASGDVWLGTSAADAILRYAPRTGRFTVYPLPTRGALVRHLAVDPRTRDGRRDLWIAYGAAPGPAARVARLSVK